MESAVHIDDYMLPCVNKKYLGFECMGCGLQRSAALILKGEFTEAFFMYPAIYTILALFGAILFNYLKPHKYGNKIIIILAFLNVAVIVISFLIKQL